jgi:hypothetical protein
MCWAVLVCLMDLLLYSLRICLDKQMIERDFWTLVPVLRVFILITND